MRSDRDKRSDSEREIDDFLSQFETPVEDISTDYTAYLPSEDKHQISRDTIMGYEELEKLTDSAKYNKREVKAFSWDENKSNSYSSQSSHGELRTASSGLKQPDNVVPAPASFVETAKPVPVEETVKPAGKHGLFGHRSGKKTSAATVVVPSVEPSVPVNADPITDIPAPVSTVTEAPVKSRKELKREKAAAKKEQKLMKAKSKAAKVSNAGGNAKRGKLSSITGKGSASFGGIVTDIKNADKSALKYKYFLKDNPDYDPSKGDTYMLAGKKINNKPTKVSPKKIFLDVIALGATFVVIGMIYCMFAITMAPRVNPDDIYASVEQSSIVYDDQGKQCDSIYYTENRKIIKYKDLPEDLVNSFIAIEDKTFRKHHGFNWIRVVGAVVSSVTGGGSISGTSTITQQLARNVYLSDTKSVRSMKRKILEMYYASRIEAKMSKDEIVEAYLNTIYLGFGCYGVSSAANAYFSKDVKDLNLVECASLAALPPAPDTYALVKYADAASVSDADTNIIIREPDTYVANDTTKDRRNTVLTLMKNQGYIDENEYNKYYDMPLIKFIHPTISSGNGSASYFHEYLVDTIIEDLMEKYKMDYTSAERMLYTQGLKVYSTMDSKAQKVIVKEFQNSDNYPYVSGATNTDSDGNIVSSDGVILLYDYDNFFDSKGNFNLSSKEVNVNSDGSITIKRGKRLNIFTTTSNGETDYSLEFKQTYKYDDGTLYSISGGYINVPSTYKSLDDNDDLVISAQYFQDYPDIIKINGNKVTITEKAYTLPQKTIQPQSAMVIVGVGTGEVKAMVGGRTTKGERLLNRALNARQPGSSIKPLAVYGAALQKSFELAKANKKWKLIDFGIDKQGTKGYGDYITTHSSVADERTTINGKEWPKNAEGGFSGDNTFMTAIQQSINTCAVKIQLQVGNEFSAQMLEKFGLSTIITDESQEVNDMNPAALALGGMSNGVIPLEMALAYASFPAGGKLNTPICYSKVVDRNGEVVLESESKQTEVMDEGVAWIMTKVLQSVVTNGIAGSARVDNVQSGGKTGTTNDQYDIWFDGFTPTYAASLWIGTDNNIKMSSMSGPAAALWGKIMRQIPKACSGKYAEQPSNVIQTSGCYFTKGTETGLSKYKPDEDKKKKEAYNKWLAERENHKTWVVDQEAVYEEVPYDETEIIHHPAETREVTDPDTGETTTEVVKEAWDEEVVVHKVKKVLKTPEKGHWEYEPGWRKGDFKYKE